MTVLLVAAGCSGTDEPDRLSHLAMADDTVQQWRLPDRLREISGLALSPDGRLFAVTDEVAVVFEINYTDGKLVRAFSLEDPPVPGDFEGIAWHNGRLYLTTSDGILYSAPEPTDGAHAEASRIDTGLGERCEVEGLADNAGTDSLYFICKDGVKGSKLSDLQIFVWSVADQRITGSITRPLADIERALGMKSFNPSGIVFDPASDSFLVVAARQRALVELGTDGRLISARRFSDPGRHRQAEGIELTSSGKLLIADEGADGKARLAVYEPQRNGGSR